MSVKTQPNMPLPVGFHNIRGQRRRPPQTAERHRHMEIQNRGKKDGLSTNCFATLKKETKREVISAPRGVKTCLFVSNHLVRDILKCHLEPECQLTLL